MDRHRVGLIALLLLMAGIYLLGNGSIPLMDRDEPRYAQTSRQMLDSGDWVVPRLYDEIRAKKPPLVYWCQASAMALFGETAFSARLPSALAMIASSVLLAGMVYRSCGGARAFWTALVFCTSALVIAAAKSSMTDSLLLLWVIIGQLCLYAIWRGNRSWFAAIVMAIAVALGLLTKVVIVMVLPATMATLGIMRWRWGPVEGEEPRPGSWPVTGPIGAAKKEDSTASKWVKCLVGALLVLLIAGPWVVLVRHRAPDFLSAMKNEGIGHMSGNMEGHSGYPGTHLLLIWADFFPWSLLLPAAIVFGWRNRRRAHARFALAAAIGPWAVMEAVVRTKLPQYMLPTIPALAFLAAGAIEEGITDRYHGFSSKPFVGAARIWAVVVILLGLLPWLAAMRFRPIPWVATTAVSLLAITWGASVFWFLRRGWRSQGIAAIGAGMMGMSVLLFGVYLPRAQFLRLSIFAANVLKGHDAIHPGDAIMTDYKEPSLAFYQGGTIRERQSPTVVKGKFDQWAPWIVMTRDVWNRCPPEIQARLKIVADFHGLSVADGMRDVHVLVVRQR